MSAIAAFDEWFDKLSVEGKSEIVLHIIKNKFKRVNEGYYGGPSGIVMKGLFGGPSGMQSQEKCPVCGKKW